jgi:hypothetical protein
VVDADVSDELRQAIDLIGYLLAMHAEERLNAPILQLALQSLELVPDLEDAVSKLRATAEREQAPTWGHLIPLLLKQSIHAGRCRLARQPHWTAVRQSTAWSKVRAAFPTADSVQDFWVLAEALSTAGPDETGTHPQTFLRYCIRRGWLQRV